MLQNSANPAPGAFCQTALTSSWSPSPRDLSVQQPGHSVTYQPLSCAQSSGLSSQVQATNMAYHTLPANGAAPADYTVQYSSSHYGSNQHHAAQRDPRQTGSEILNNSQSHWAACPPAQAVRPPTACVSQGSSSCVAFDFDRFCNNNFRCRNCSFRCSCSIHMCLYW